MRAIGYIRVSTDEQAQSGLGLAAQAQAIHVFASQNGLELVEIFRDEGISGAKSAEARPGLAAALAVLKKGDVLLVAKRDRLARDVVVMAAIQKVVARAKGKIISTMGEGTNGNSASDELLRGMVDVLSQYERGLIRERTRAALKMKRDRNEKCGGKVPYGFRLKGDEWLPDEKEQNVINAMKVMKKHGMSDNAIAKRLNKEMIRTKDGKFWTNVQIGRILSREETKVNTAA